MLQHVTEKIDATQFVLIHKLIKGEKRVIGRDDFDFLMAKRDKRLAAEKKEGFAK